jgi:hypothetical protein
MIFLQVRKQEKSQSHVACSYPHFTGIKAQNPNTTFTAGCTLTNVEPPKARDDDPCHDADLDAVTKAANSADQVVLALGETREMSGEAESRTSLNLPGQDQQLINAVIAHEGQWGAALIWSLFFAAMAGLFGITLLRRLLRAGAPICPAAECDCGEEQENSCAQQIGSEPAHVMSYCCERSLINSGSSTPIALASVAFATFQLKRARITSSCALESALCALSRSVIVPTPAR